MAGKKGRSGGHNRKSVDLHKLEGTYENSRHKNVLVPEECLVKVFPQEHVSNANPYIDRELIFEQFSSYLHDAEMTQDSDSILLSQLVEYYAAYVEAISYFKADPTAMFGKKLAITVANEMAREIRIIMAEFRLTPSTRARVAQSSKEVSEDPVDAFLNAKIIGEE